MDTVYLVSDVAAALDIPDHAVRYLERTGACPAFARTPGGVRLFDRATVQRVKRERSRASVRGRRR